MISKEQNLRKKIEQGLAAGEDVQSLRKELSDLIIQKHNERFAHKL